MAWVDGSPGIDDEQALLWVSGPGGTSWRSAGRPVPIAGHPYYVAPAIAPDGSQMYLSYNAFLNDYQDTTATPRSLVGGLLRSSVAADGTPSDWTVVDTGEQGDPRASSQNNIVAEFLGDYVYAIATRTYGAGVYNDVRDAEDCPAVDRYRQAYEDGVRAGELPPIAIEDSPAERDAEEEAAPQEAAAAPARPSITAQCPADFGNSDIYGATSAP
jgi:hypothetical protein